MIQQALIDQKIWIPGNVIVPGIEDKIAYSTKMRVLFRGDILNLLPFIRSESIDTVFADPPFNLSKGYGAKVNDNRSDDEYVCWCKNWTGISETCFDLRIRGLVVPPVIHTYKWSCLGDHLCTMPE